MALFGTKPTELVLIENEAVSNEFVVPSVAAVGIAAPIDELEVCMVISPYDVAVIQHRDVMMLWCFTAMMSIGPVRQTNSRIFTSLSGSAANLI